MTSHNYRIATAQDIDFIRRAEQQGFACSAADVDRAIKQTGLERFRIVERDSHPVGQLVVLPSAQWWLGQKIPMAGIAAVSILPEARRQGNARALLQGMLRELHDAKIPLSALYSAADPLYRQMGYGAGGTSCDWQVSAHQIGVSKMPLPVQPAAFDSEVLQPIQQRYACHHSGHLDRHAGLWAQILGSEDRPLYGYLMGRDAPEGYILYDLSFKAQSTLSVVDWAIATPAAGHTLWAFIAQHSSQFNVVQWRGGAADPMALLLPDQTANLQNLSYWMLRLVDVPLALAARGYPTGVTAELSLEVADSALPVNQGCWTLSVSEGRGQVTSGSVGALSLSASALASLYSGLLSPYQMRQMGWLAGPDEAVAIAAALFAGPSPWMPDRF